VGACVRVCVRVRGCVGVCVRVRACVCVCYIHNIIPPEIICSLYTYFLLLLSESIKFDYRNKSFFFVLRLNYFKFHKLSHASFMLRGETSKAQVNLMSKIKFPLSIELS
jgi:hypothetical protein